MSYSSLGAQVWHVLMRLHSFTCHPHVHPQVEWTIPAYNITPSCSASRNFWLAFISRFTKGRRLSWPGWLGEILKWFARPKTVTHPSICHGGWELNLRPSSCESNALTTRLLNRVWITGVCAARLIPWTCRLQSDNNAKSKVDDWHTLD